MTHFFQVELAGQGLSNELFYISIAEMDHELLLVIKILRVSMISLLKKGVLLYMFIIPQGLR